jgi:plasmid stabilization system protein ParE
MRVRYAPQAQLDIASIYNHTVVQNPTAAPRVEDHIHSAIELLATFPGLGVATDEEDVRRLPPGRFPYTVFYQVDERAGEVHILRVIRASRVRDLGRLP